LQTLTASLQSFNVVQQINSGLRQYNSVQVTCDCPRWKDITVNCFDASDRVDKYVAVEFCLLYDVVVSSSANLTAHSLC